MTERITEREMLERAARGLGKIDLWGPRGLTMITIEELEDWCHREGIELDR